MKIGDLLIWNEFLGGGEVSKTGVLIDVPDERGHYHVLKLLLGDEKKITIRYFNNLPEILNNERR
jgi:hypothetical protein